MSSRCAATLVINCNSNIPQHFGGEALFEKKSVHDVFALSECMLFEIDLSSLTAIAHRFPMLRNLIKQVRK